MLIMTAITAYNPNKKGRSCHNDNCAHHPQATTKSLTEQNVKQADYEMLAKGAADGKWAHYMTDEEAKDWISSEFDFDRDKITILHEVDELEINRHRQLRKTGRKIDRRPIYCATDYHYIRFNTSRWYYEVWNDTFRPFYD